MDPFLPATKSESGIHPVTRMCVLGAAVLLAVLTGGCAHDPARPAASQPPRGVPAVVSQTPAQPPVKVEADTRGKAAVSGEKPAIREDAGTDAGDYGDYKEDEDKPAAPEKKTAGGKGAGADAGDYGDYKEEGEKPPAGGDHADVTDKGAAPPPAIADPIEPFNRAMYHFNDKLYFWVLKPVAQGYNLVVPEWTRISVRDFFSNLGFPVRFINCLLLADMKCAGTELGRFVINTTAGIGGFFDPASLPEVNLKKQDVDFGQTLGVYGVGHGFFIMWPVLGPSSPRDSVGIVGDYFLYPVSYIEPWYLWLAVRGYQEVNSASLRIGDYESLKSAAIDPYVAIRDFYIQYRRNQIEDRKKKGGGAAQRSDGIPPEKSPGP